MCKSDVEIMTLIGIRRKFQRCRLNQRLYTENKLRPLKTPITEKKKKLKCIFYISTNKRNQNTFGQPQVTDK